MTICEKTVVALGSFDGCHAGHLAVINGAKKLAVKKGAKTLVYTFDTLTKDVSKGRNILTFAEKIKRLSKTGADYIAVDSFENVKNTDGETFVKDILIGKLHCIGASCGFNYKFGKGAACDASKLKELFENEGLCVQICDKICVNGEVLSSTLIRRLIENGETEKILDFADPYSVYAEVVHGKMLGRTIGIPTINQFIPKDKIVPKRGVYITECEIGDDVYPSITNVGIRPTVDGKNAKENMETHIIGFDKNLYGSYIKVNFYKFLRDEKTFESVEKLKEEIERNIKDCKNYFCIDCGPKL
jgi:riboflavin kinase/FMN adenylyltransferase